MNAKGMYLKFDRFIGDWVVQAGRLQMTPEERIQFQSLLETLDVVSADLQKFFYSLPDFP